MLAVSPVYVVGDGHRSPTHLFQITYECDLMEPSYFTYGLNKPLSHTSWKIYDLIKICFCKTSELKNTANDIKMHNNK